MALLIASPSASAEPEPEPAPATPAGSPSDWFGPDTYPVEALRLNQQGRVVAILDIDKNGKPTACRVDISSGAPALDRGTCALAMTRGIFVPSRNSRGRPVAATFRLPVIWKIPEIRGDLSEVVIRETGGDVRCSLARAGVDRLLKPDTCRSLADAVKQGGQPPGTPVFISVPDERLAPIDPSQPDRLRF